MKLRLDLHTHCREALKFAPLDVSIVRKILAAAKRLGLDGLAITDHAEMGKDFAYQVKELVERFFDNQLLIIPGQELRRGVHHVVELYLGEEITFRFISHPGDLSGRLAPALADIHGLEVESGNWFLDQEEIARVAQENELLLLRNSDAHSLSAIGEHYNEIDLQELISRARSKP